MGAKFTYQHITDVKAMEGVVAEINLLGQPVALDLETTGLNRFKDKILCGVLSTHVNPDGGGAAVMVEPELLPQLLNLQVPLILHNFRFDLPFLYEIGVDLRGRDIRDTMLLHHLVDENASHGLDDLVQERYHDNYKEVFWGKYKSYSAGSYEDRLEYACKDAIYTALIHEELLTELKIQNIPDSLVEHVYQLAYAMYETELTGLKVDLDYLFKVGGELKTRIDAHKKELRALTPEVELVELELWQREIAAFKTEKKKQSVSKPEFNWDSTKQLQTLLHDTLGIRKIQRKSKATKKVAVTLDDAALEELSAAHPLISHLQQYRADAKVYGTYIEGILERQHAGRIYSSFNINGTVTGRISSSNPNMQNLPREGAVRGIYIPDCGHSLVSADYAQLEVVIAAHFSQEPNLLKIIFEGASKHDITAAGLGIDRQTAKTINFSLQYGATKYKVKQILGCSDADAEHALNKYWETYAKEKEVVDACRDKVDRGEPIVNLFGRQRRFPRIFDADWKRQEAYRQAYSSLIQGTGADITNRSYYVFHRFMVTEQIGKALFQVHDQIVGQVVAGQDDRAIKAVNDIMVHTGRECGLNVPLKTDVQGYLDRWVK